MKTLLGIGLVAVAGLAQAQLLGPSVYAQASDSPFTGLSFTYFHLETLEDNLFNVPGVTKSTGNVLAPSGLTDSVDADDGKIDGLGRDGHSIFSGAGSSGIMFTFSAAALGSLPTHAGIVWTDGGGTITFEAFDANGASLGTRTGNHADGSSSGTTVDDRFYGVINAGGISKIFIKNSSGGIEVDHLQYGGAVPEPGTLGALGLGALVALLRKRN